MYYLIWARIWHENGEIQLVWDFSVVKQDEKERGLKGLLSASLSIVERKGVKLNRPWTSANRIVLSRSLHFSNQRAEPFWFVLGLVWYILNWVVRAGMVNLDEDMLNPFHEIAPRILEVRQLTFGKIYSHGSRAPKGAWVLTKLDSIGICRLALYGWGDAWVQGDSRR